MSLNMVGYSVF